MWCMDFIEMQAWCVKFEVRCDLPPEVYVTHDYFSFILWKYQIFSWNLTLKKRDLKFPNLNLWCMNCLSKYTQCVKFLKFAWNRIRTSPLSLILTHGKENNLILHVWFILIFRIFVFPLQLPKGIKNLEQLKLLDISHCTCITDGGLRSICQLRNLTTLNINMCTQVQFMVTGL